ncbi:hypothetical protein AB0J82_15350 [Asanoa sp. NPDC049518]|uniref:RHS repeat domain-containing protein n=1 Tax=unclassified Asanoa TaxID=2685164 RepID=UPI003414E7CB
MDPRRTHVTRTDTFDTNAGGYTTTRNVNGVNQTLTWDAEGRLESTTQPGLTTGYIYDAGGNRLLRKDNNGATNTLYLGNTELKRTVATGQVEGTRYYSHDGDVIGARPSSGLTWLVADHHATNEASIDPNTLSLTRRRSLPFGEPRGVQPANWPGTRGFVNGTIDPTGLVNLGAREYDPGQGRFISPDPLFDVARPTVLERLCIRQQQPGVLHRPDGLRAMTMGDGVRIGTGAGGVRVPGGGFRGWLRRMVKGKPTPKPKVSGGVWSRAPRGRPADMGDPPGVKAAPKVKVTQDNGGKGKRKNSKEIRSKNKGSNPKPKKPKHKVIKADFESTGKRQAEKEKHKGRGKQQADERPLENGKQRDTFNRDANPDGLEDKGASPPEVANDIGRGLQAVFDRTPPTTTIGTTHPVAQPAASTTGATVDPILGAASLATMSLSVIQKIVLRRAALRLNGP